MKTTRPPDISKLVVQEPEMEEIGEREIGEEAKQSKCRKCMSKLPIIILYIMVLAILYLCYNSQA